MNEPRTYTLFGFSGVHDQNKAYGETITALLDRVWTEVRSRGLAHGGINHVVYDGSNIFAGIELIAPVGEVGLEKKELAFDRYASCKHIGPYRELGTTYRNMKLAVEAQGEQCEAPFMEIYGHWNEDESKLKTEIVYILK
jgi:effector-binding domain-containing protein